VTDGQGGAVTATYGSAPYTATSCTVTVADTAIQCTSAAGYGAGLAWTVVVNGVSSAPSLATTSYHAPTINIITVGASGTSMATAGGESLVITGTNFGPVGTPVAVQYGPNYWKYTATACSVSIASTHVTCTSLPGYGATFVWQVTVGGSATNAVPFALLGYTVPAVTALSLTTGANPNGGEAVTITGTNFGATDIDVDQFGHSWPILSVTYSNGGAPLTPTGCRTVSQTSITCVTAPGVGSGYKWTVTVDKQTSTPSLATLSYRPAPVISNVVFNHASPSGPVITFMQACGGDSVTLTGTYMGVSSDSVSVTYSNGGAAKTATGCAVVDATTVTCSTVAGVGSNYAWVVTVNGQASAAFGSTSYVPPAIVTSVFVAGAGTNADISTPGAHTIGGDFVVFVGVNFGFSNDAFTAESSNDGAVWTWSPACVQRNMPPNGVVIACTLTPGFGTSFQWQLYVNGQQAQTIGFTTNYRPPTVVAAAVHHGAGLRNGALLERHH
jgi:hypothetical protein